MIGSTGLLAATAAKSTVSSFLATMNASADVLALAKVEVEMANIPEGKNAIIKWRGKPVFIRHRTQDEIDEANTVDVKSLRDPESDDARTQKPEWLVMLGVCTHLGCVPIGESGDFGGWCGDFFLGLVLVAHRRGFLRDVAGSARAMARTTISVSSSFYPVPPPLSYLLSSLLLAGRVRKGPAPVSCLSSRLRCCVY
jgi:hypothetical protein